MGRVTDEARLSWLAAEIVTPEDLAGQFLSELAGFVGATSSIVYYFATGGRLEPLGGNAADAVPGHGRTFAAQDPLMLSVIARSQIPFAMVQQTGRADLVVDRDFRRSIVYQQHYRAMDVEHFLFLFPSDRPFGHDGMAGFLLGRHESAEPFDVALLDHLSVIEGALRAAVRRMLRGQAAQQQRDALATMIERGGEFPVVMLDERQKLIWGTGDALARIERYPEVLPSIRAMAAQLQASLDRPSEIPAPWTFRKRLGPRHVLQGELEVVRDTWLRPIIACHFKVEVEARDSSMKLSAAEGRVLDGIVGGLSNKEIGEQLGLSVDTVRTHVRKLLAKLGVDSRVKAALWAAKNRELP